MHVLPASRYEKTADFIKALQGAFGSGDSVLVVDGEWAVVALSPERARELVAERLSLKLMNNPEAMERLLKALEEPDVEKHREFED